MLAQCPRWQGDGGSAAADAGKARHIALGRCLSNDPDPLRGLPEEDADKVQWAADYIRTIAPTSDHPMRMEYHVKPLDADFNPLFENGGTLDVSCGPFLFDLKNKERDYSAQMAAYALGMFQEDGWPEVEVHLLFAEGKRALKYRLTEESAVAIVSPIIAAARDAGAKPVPCDYCDWCANRLTCPALLDQAFTIAAARAEVAKEDTAAFNTWIANGAHTSKIEDPALMGAVLRVARVLASWCEAAEFRAKDMAIKTGSMPVGFKLQSRQGNRFITGVSDAFTLIGLPQDDFLCACECKPSLLFERYAAFHGLKKAQAERDVQTKLGDLIQRKPASQSLVAEKTK
jgi:hypothetical protein